MPSGTGHFLRAYAAAGARIERTTRSGAKSWLVKWRLGGGRNGNLFALAIPLRTGFTRQALDAA
ncbi:hypothetical protein AB0392_10745 [Nonomuraea angiospora]|uniref:hypothetical protein n=1 Tax=Nonomuraea angiospora TaxID=46172 RepID=UPI00344F8F01